MVQITIVSGAFTFPHLIMLPVCLE